MIRKLILGVLVSSSVLFAGSLDYAGKIQAHYASGIRGENAGRCLIGGLLTEGEVKGSLDESSFYADGIIEFNAVEAFSDYKLEAKLKEAWFDYNGTWYSFRIGRQISAWGAADGLIVADVLCPQDCTAFLASKISESRLGIDAVRFSLISSSVIFDAYAIPFFTPAKLPETGINVKKTEVSLENVEYAVRFSSFLKALDFSLYGYYGFMDEPVMENHEGVYKKFTMAGADASIPVGDFTVRTEAAFFPQKAFSTIQKEDSVRRNELKALAGIDWMKSSWKISGQYFCRNIFGNTSGIPEKSFAHSATLNVSYSWDSANLEFSCSGVLNLDDLDSAIELKVEHDFSDSIKFCLSSKLMNPGPEKDGTYGSMKDRSCIVLKGTYSF